ncbi:MAG: serine/threonine protein kinase [Myxococcales bacterium]|nr:serine/threonine protein kinase [Myxococcales bacterium]
MGRVFAAVDRRQGGLVALKLPRVESEPIASRRLARETAILAEIDAAPGLAVHVDHGVEEGVPWLATRWIEGPTLATRVARGGPLAVSEALAMLAILAGALAALHAHRVVHRDLSPSNVLLRDDDPRDPVLVDFGAARDDGAGETAAGSFVGTPGFLAPEQARGGHDLDARVDVWGLGALLHFALTGEVPLPGRTTTTLLARVLFEDPPWLCDLRPEIPSSVAALAQRLLARERAERPRDAAAVLRELPRVEGASEVTAPTREPIPGTLLVVHGAGDVDTTVADALRTLPGWAQLPDRTLVAFSHGAEPAREAAQTLRRALPAARVALADGASLAEAADRLDTLGAAPTLDPDDPDVAPGAVLADRYTLERPLGAGGMGEVWSARHRTLGSPVAIKLLHGSLVEHPELRRRFLDEARITARLDSAHAVRVFDFGVTVRGRPFLAMERIDGEALSDRIAREGRLSPIRAVEFLGQAARAIDRAHALGIVHRDLKPANVLVTRDEDGREVAKLVDFGIAKLAGGLAVESPSSERQGALERTRAGLGTPAYMSPEQVRGDPSVGPATDRFALGVVAFHCLTGRLPWSARDVPGTFAEILEGKLPTTAGELPAAFDAWLARACAADPDDRFASARESVEGLAVALGLAPRASRARWIGLAVAIGAGATVLGLRLRRPDVPPSPVVATSASAERVEGPRSSVVVAPSGTPPPSPVVAPPPVVVAKAPKVVASASATPSAASSAALVPSTAASSSVAATPSASASASGVGWLESRQ